MKKRLHGGRYLLAKEVWRGLDADWGPKCAFFRDFLPFRRYLTPSVTTCFTPSVTPASRLPLRPP